MSETQETGYHDTPDTERHPHDNPPVPEPRLPAPLRWVVLAVANGFGFGMSPVASGTTGTLIALPLVWYLAPPYGGWFAYALATLVFTVLGVLCATAAEGIWQKKDDGRIAIDEIAGMLFAMFLIPMSGWSLLIGFLLFRLFDILKPPPAHRLQAVPGGLGIVLDDVIAGIYACIVHHLLRWGWCLVFGCAA